MISVKFLKKTQLFIYNINNQELNKRKQSIFYEIRIEKNVIIC